MSLYVAEQIDDGQSVTVVVKSDTTSEVYVAIEAYEEDSPSSRADAIEKATTRALT